MENRIKKMLALIICMAMMMSILAACGNSAPAATEAPAENGAANVESKEEVKEEVKEIVPAKSFNFYGLATGISTEEYNANPLGAMVEEFTGYDVNWDQVPTGTDEATTAINNIFINREDYQAIVVTKNQFFSLLAQDALYDISDLVEKSANLKDQISDMGWQMASKDGGIYAIPRKAAAIKAAVSAIVYREDWLIAYNEANPDAQIPVPSEENGYTMSVSDFKTMLEYFKAQVPQGGSAYHVDTDAVMQDNIMPAFGIYAEWQDVDGVLTHYVDHPGFEGYLTYMQGLLDDGLMTYAATAGEATVVKLMQAGQLGAGRVFHWNAATIEGSEGTDSKIGYIANLVADADKGDLSKIRKFANDTYDCFTVIPKYTSDEQAAAVVDFADKMLDEEFFLKLALGEEGVTFTIEETGYYPILPAFNDERGLADKFLIGSREVDYGQYWLCRTRKTQAQDKLFSRVNWNAEETGVASVIGFMPSNEAYDNYYSGANRELTTALVTTMFGTDRMTVDQLRAVFNGNGGDLVKESVNEWYAAWEGKDLLK